ncbi:hypothetical protein ES332_D09G077500v1 [Gossypium tomentosum]|uniref:Uncharacterized protein n=1 Tax=Gossypium tomentosum TaxID=34277 RepID=A0A5D2JF26_GOSTO|nr:hypothetical protein ES332_D09G077500v1 [Gossypium tomentosum]
MSVVSPLLIFQDLHCMRHLFYPESRMLVTPYFLRHRMSSFVGLPCSIYVLWLAHPLLCICLGTSYLQP